MNTIEDIFAPAIAGTVLATAAVFGLVAELTAAPVGWDNPAVKPILYWGATADWREDQFVPPTGAYLDCLVGAQNDGQISPSALPACVR